MILPQSKRKFTEKKLLDRRKAEVEFFTPHDLRRSCITNWAKKLPIQVVQHLAGHSNMTTTRKYYLSVQKSDLKVAREIQSKLMTKLTNF